MKHLFKHLVVIAALCGVAMLSGCTDDVENESQLPWNTPKGWEGAPPGMGMPGTGSGSY